MTLKLEDRYTSFIVFGFRKVILRSVTSCLMMRERLEVNGQTMYLLFHAMPLESDNFTVLCKGLRPYRIPGVQTTEKPNLYAMSSMFYQHAFPK